MNTFKIILAMALLGLMFGAVNASLVIHEVGVEEPDIFYSPCAGNNIVNVWANVSGAAIVNASFIFDDDFSVDCGGGIGNVTLTYNSESELYEGVCDVTDESAISEFRGGAVIIIALDDKLPPYVSSDNSTEIILYNMTTPPMPEGGCDRFGELTTNMCEVTNFSDVNFIIEVQTNGTCQSERIGQNLPWEGFKTMVKFNFSSVDMTSEDIGGKLAAIGEALSIYITPPGMFGDSWISVDVEAFDALNGSTTIGLFGLPFSTLPAIYPDDGVTVEDFVLNAPYEIEITCGDIIEDEELVDEFYAELDDCGENETCEGAVIEEFFGDYAENYTTCVDGCSGDEECEDNCALEWMVKYCEEDWDEEFTMYVPNTDLFFTVGHFSQYNITDTVSPEITFKYPTNNLGILGDENSSFLINVTVNGTGSQISELVFIVDDNEPLVYEYSELFEVCTNETAEWDVITCADVNVSEISRGDHVITVIATDFGGDEGNTAEETIVFTFYADSDSVLGVEVEAETETELEFLEANITLYLINSTNVSMVVSPRSPSASGATASLIPVKGIRVETDEYTKGNLTWALIKIYYDDSEIEGLDEDSLRIYYYNETSEDWEVYDTPNGGVNTTGKYVWANTTHFSEFGVFGEETATETPRSSGRSSGGTIGSTAPVAGQAYTMRFGETYQNIMRVRDRINFNYRGNDHVVELISVSLEVAVFDVSSETQRITVAVGESEDVDVDGDGIEDISIAVNSISAGNVDVTIIPLSEEEIESVAETVEPEEPALVSEPAEEVSEPTLEQRERTTFMVMLAVAAVIVALAVIAYLKFRGKQTK
ncbi:MAG TPA: hypothetical protein ENN30_02175 [Candidatus Woesearchaeota archaeon]|nr:hypothetical protein [Candidatus Woesearchaeota archaeon]